MAHDGKIGISDVSGMFKISRPAALKEIGRLVGLGVLKLKGKGGGRIMWRFELGCPFGCHLSCQFKESPWEVSE